MDLRALINRVRAGDHEAFAALVQRYQGIAFGYAVALLGDFHTAQDVVQEAFVIAYYRRWCDQYSSPPIIVQLIYCRRYATFVARRGSLMRPCASQVASARANWARRRLRW